MNCDWWRVGVILPERFDPSHGYVRLACITHQGRLLTASDPNLLRAWDLSQTRLPADVIADYSRLASGRLLTAAGVVLPLKPHELADLARSLHQRVPQLFE